MMRFLTGSFALLVLVSFGCDDAAPAAPAADGFTAVDMLPAPDAAGADMGEPEPDMGEPLPDMGEPLLDMGEPPPDMGEPAPDKGEPEPTPDMGEPAPDMGEPEPTPDMGEPEPTPDMGEPEPTPDMGEPEPAVALEIRPNDVEIAVGDTVDLSAWDALADGAPLTDVVLWAIDDAAVAALDPATPGRVRGVAAGETTVRATLDGAQADATLRVRAAELRRIEVEPAGPLPLGISSRLTARGVWSDGAMADVSAQVEWQSLDDAIARIEDRWVRGVAEGRARVVATLDGVSSDPIEVEITPAEVTELVLEGENVPLPAGRSNQFTLWALWTDLRETDVTVEAAWESADEAIAVTRFGGVDAVGVGVTTITARFGGLERAVEIEVLAPVIEAVTVDPAEARLAAGDVQAFTAEARRSDGSRVDVTAAAEWQVDAPAVAAVVEPGRVRGISAGETQVRATVDDVTAVASLAVTPAELRRLTIAPVAPTVRVGETVALSAESAWSDGRVADATAEARWTSADEAIATVAAGQVTGVAPGEVTIRAEIDGVRAERVITVDARPNAAPVPALRCPDLGRIDTALEVDARGSMDPDGRIVAYRWSFGDGGPAIDSGLEPAIAYTYAVAGDFTVRLTVVDDAGATTDAECVVRIIASAAPTVTLVRPQGRVETTQGAAIETLVDARPAGGRAIVSVELLVDDAVVAETAELPYAPGFEVPLDAESGDELQLVARATDDLGGVGVSAPVTLAVLNDPPEAIFVATPVAARRVAVDARGVSDDHTAVDALEVRWDFDDDGVWDTPFSVDKQAVHTYDAEGRFTIRLQVRDAVGLTADATRTVEFAAERFVAGEIESDLWFGTIYVTGDVRLLPGHTLTIADGTTVLFTRFDQNGDGVGDLGLTIDGTLDVQGTAESPVVFTVFEEERRNNGWAQVRLNGGPHTIRHAVFEYGNAGLWLASTAELEHVLIREMGADCLTIRAPDVVVRQTTVHDCQTGIRGVDADRLLLEDVTTRDNRAAGMRLDSANDTVSRDLAALRNAAQGVFLVSTRALMRDVQIVDNGHIGLLAQNAPLDLYGGVVRGSGNVGLQLLGRTSGSVQRFEITENANEGVQLGPIGLDDPSVVLRRNNIHSNAARGARPFLRFDPPGLFAATSNRDTMRSDVYAAPEGQVIVAAQVGFWEGTSGWGELLGNGGERIRSWQDSQTQWLVMPANTTELRAVVHNSRGPRATTMNVLQLITRGATVDAPLQVTTARVGGSLDLRENYFGGYPDLFTHVRSVPRTAVNLDGAVGAPFDADWQTGPYYGGAPIEPGTVWSGEIFLNGRLSVPAEADLTIEAGTTIHVSPLDYQLDGIGDTVLNATGPVMFAGTAEAPIRVRTHGLQPGEQAVPQDWRGIILRHADSTVDHTTVEGAHYGFELYAGVPLRDTTVRHSHRGFDTRAGVVLERIRAESNAELGVVLRGDATVTDAYALDNGQSGIYLSGAGNALRYVDASRNRRAGIFANLGTTAEITDCVASFNDGAGIRVNGRKDALSNVTVRGCNLFGNAAEGTAGADGPVRLTDGLPQAIANSRAGTVDSAPWAVPADMRLVQMRAQFWEFGTGSASLWDQDEERLWDVREPAAAWIAVPDGTASVRARASNVGQRTNTLTVLEAHLVQTGRPDVQLSVNQWTAGRVVARENWWGGPTPEGAFVEGVAGAVDVQAWRPVAFPANAVGPRF